MGGNQESVKDVWYKIFSLNDTFLSWVKGQYIIVLHLCKKYLTFFPRYGLMGRLCLLCSPLEFEAAT